MNTEKQCKRHRGRAGNTWQEIGKWYADATRGVNKSFELRTPNQRPDVVIHSTFAGLNLRLSGPKHAHLLALTHSQIAPESSFQF